MVCEVSIRPMTVRDLQACWELDQRCFADGETYDRDTLRYLLTNPLVIARKIELPDGRMVGFVIGSMEPGGVGHVIALGVDPQWRRRGFGRLLMDALEEAFSEHGATIARLEVRVDNHAAQALYQKLGYTVTQHLPRYYTNGEDALLMMKPLPSPAPDE
ncbi:Ribosomal-protein-alanine acetyltransferase [bacterium HR10]|nr:Ribosomal-protein-alanine acetyltransferase [bacterium HR10]